MSVWNGKPLSLLRMMKPAAWSNAGRQWWTRLRKSPLLPSLGFVLMLFLLAASLTGCGTISTQPSVGPRNPEPPPTRLSESPPDYLNDARRDISEWRKTLQELIAKPVN